MSNGVKLLDDLQEVVEASVDNLLIGSVAIHHFPPGSTATAPIARRSRTQNIRFGKGCGELAVADAWTWCGSPWRIRTRQSPCNLPVELAGADLPGGRDRVAPARLRRPRPPSCPAYARAR